MLDTAIEPVSRGRRRVGAILLASLAGLILLAQVNAAPAAGAVPAGFQDSLLTSVTSPTDLAFTPNRRLLMTSQPGVLRIYKDGATVTALDISAKICSNSERGLLGVAVDPSFSTNKFIYLYYTFKKFGLCPLGEPTNSANPVNRVSRFTLPDSNVINPASEKVLIDNIASPNGNHNGGDLQFGPGGALYVSVGEGGTGGAPARVLNNLNGKILRISKGGAIPSDNPFVGPNSVRCNVTGQTDAGKQCREIYAYGLRNPFRFGFDPNTSGARFFINDTGQSTWEEIDLGKRGADYGWNIREGHCATGSTTNCGPPPAGMTNPIFDYQHGTCNAITGGAFVPNGFWPAQYNGAYMYADLTCGKIFRLKPAGGGGFTSAEFGTGLGRPVSLTFGPYVNSRALYYTNYASGGQVRRIAFTG
jgi:glucose/arabinose dehydrogenase